MNAIDEVLKLGDAYLLSHMTEFAIIHAIDKIKHNVIQSLNQSDKILVLLLDHSNGIKLIVFTE